MPEGDKPYFLSSENLTISWVKFVGKVLNITSK